MRLLVFGVMTVAACSGPGKPRLPPPATSPPPFHVIDGGVLRSLMIAGELRVPIDDATREAMLAKKHRSLSADISVCLDAEGVASIEMVHGSGFPAYDAAVQAAIDGWRFRPYVRDGAVTAACSTATFEAILEETEGVFGPLPVGARDALPEPAIELPPSVASVDTIPHRETDEPPAPGLALAVVCRQRGARTAPRATLVQSSGDPSIDRGLLDRRIAMPRGEARGGEGCVLTSAMAPPGMSPAHHSHSAWELRRRRISGNVLITPSDLIKNVIRRRPGGPKDIVAVVAVCVNGEGRVDFVEPVGSSGYIGYDVDLVNRMARWTFKPTLHGGRAVRTCTMVRFQYRQR